MLFNINEFIKVKLTPKGIAVLKERHRNLQRKFPKIGPFRMPQIDADGYTEYQMWDLMNTFGESIGLGFNIPFETTIWIPDPKEE